METTKNVFEIKSEIETLWNTFNTNHEDFKTTGTKKYAAAARKAINELKKLVTAYKKASMVEVKSGK
jgi:hypothetical protein